MDPRLQPPRPLNRTNFQDVRPPVAPAQAQTQQPVMQPVVVEQPAAATPVSTLPVAQPPSPPVAQPLPQPSAVKPQPIVSPPPQPAVPPTIGPELVESIPLAMPGQTAPAPGGESSLNLAPMPPPQPMSQHSTQPATQPHQQPDELDQILKAVNNRVAAPLSAKPKQSLLGKLSNKSKAQKEKGPVTKRPLATMTIVALVFIALSAVAVMAYRQGSKSTTLAKQPGKVGTSYQAGSAIQAAGGTLVSPSDLDDYSQNLGDKLNSLNDKGDFDSNSLSPAVLGL